jgi:hypothetical protein
MTARPLAGFVLRTLAWLPPSFGAWYLLAPWHSGVAGGMGQLIIDAYKVGVLAKLDRSGPELVFVSTLQVLSPGGQAGVLAVEVNALIYTYGLALFLALTLAARAHWRTLLIAPVVLLPFQGWGIAFDFLAQVGVKLGPAISAQAGLLGARAEFIALGYQLGALVFPSVVPVVLWAFYNRAFIVALRPADDAGTAHTAKVVPSMPGLMR